MGFSTNTQSNVNGISNRGQGIVVVDGVAPTQPVPFNCGFVPRYVRWENATDRIMLEWFDGMAQNSAIRTVAAGTRTLDVASGISVGPPAQSAGGTFMLPVAEVLPNKTYYWATEG
jgi:hypothetical protein